MSRIEHAYCVQLERLVTIDEARREFRHGQDIERFDFLCAEPACRPYRIRIAGVNYRIDAVTGRKYVENHFRRWDDHVRGCPHADVPPADAERAAARHGASHLSRALGSEIVEVFHPPVDDLPGFEALPGEPGGDADAPASRASPREPRVDEAPSGRRARTGSLARLVDSYREALATLAPAELAKRRLAVAGEGSVPLTRYLLPIREAHEGPPLRVFYGGARLLRYYGRGFKLRFYDRYRDKPTYLYVTSGAVRTAAESALIVDRLNAMERGEYSTVYALGRLDAAIDNASYSIAVTDLRRLVLHAPRTRRAAAEESHASTD